MWFISAPLASALGLVSGELRCIRFRGRSDRHRSLEGQVDSILIESGHRLSRATVGTCGSSIKGYFSKNRYLLGGPSGAAGHERSGSIAPVTGTISGTILATIGFP
jgi:hypothetical protein